MLGALFLDKEACEVEYLIKKELEELIFELNDERINHVVKRAMEERYQILFKILLRFTTQSDCLRYLRNKRNMGNNN
ncbi:hypothetical protein EV207_12676 [Scopulibacillus darangshiensis]|uniref:Uncharacterized protein n=1 Tax=Scopulibacillus darangshiensis TaxID=442528 RepID=A0A4R2NQQ8_9BACL|nr:hypothetical protein [Scopulibacillus darangshiensis]TCP24203.1 hypothetical protein EV207_12676 [Scopulibacillus darangshiensis]